MRFGTVLTLNRRGGPGQAIKRRNAVKSGPCGTASRLHCKQAFCTCDGTSCPAGTCQRGVNAKRVSHAVQVHGVCCGSNAGRVQPGSRFVGRRAAPRYHHHRGGGYNSGGAILGGLAAGALLGGIIASQPRGYAYGPGYGPGYAYGPGPATLTPRDRATWFRTTRSRTACRGSSRTTRVREPISATTATVTPARKPRLTANAKTPPAQAGGVFL